MKKRSFFAVFSVLVILMILLNIVSFSDEQNIRDRWTRLSTSRIKIGPGSAEIEPSSLVTAGTVHTWTIRFKVGEGGLGIDDGVLFCVPHGFSMPQYLNLPLSRQGTRDHLIGVSGMAGFTTVSCSNPDTKIDLLMNFEKDATRLTEAKNLYAIIKENPLKEGDTITLIYGDTRYGSPGSVSPFFAQQFDFAIIVFRKMNLNKIAGFIKSPGRQSFISAAEDYYRIAHSPHLDVFGGKAQKLTVVSPSVVEVGKQFDINIAARDKYGNISVNYEGKIEISKISDAIIPKSLVITPSDKGCKKFREAATFNKTGVYRINVKDYDNHLTAVSNPIRCVSPGNVKKIYWGDIHGHTLESDGLGTVDDYYNYGRYASFLDFCAISDHAQGVSKIIREAAIRHNYPGEFITFSAYEIGSSIPYFRDHSLDYEDLPYLEGGSTEPLERFGKKKVILTPHMHGGKWNGFDSDIVRLAEIYSVWGNAEYKGAEEKKYIFERDPSRSIQEALRTGMKVGIIASGDDHAGHPGYGDWLRRPRSNHGGLTAVIADNLIKDELFDAMWNRNLYATTGERIILNFNLNDHIMGEEVYLDSPNENRVLKVSVEATAPIRSITVVKNNKDWYIVKGKGVSGKFEIIDNEPIVMTDYYYIRVIQEDENLAWSSPIWVSVKYE